MARWRHFWEEAGGGGETPALIPHTDTAAVLPPGETQPRGALHDAVKEEAGAGPGLDQQQTPGRDGEQQGWPRADGPGLDQHHTPGQDQQGWPRADR